MLARQDQIVCPMRAPRWPPRLLKRLTHSSTSMNPGRPRIKSSPTPSRAMGLHHSRSTPARSFLLIAGLYTLLIIIVAKLLRASIVNAYLLLMTTFVFATHGFLGSSTVCACKIQAAYKCQTCDSHPSRTSQDEPDATARYALSVANHTHCFKTVIDHCVTSCAGGGADRLGEPGYG
jgi:hypothetical protein